MILTNDERVDGVVPFPSQYGKVSTIQWMHHEYDRLRRAGAKPALLQSSGTICIQVETPADMEKP